MATVIVNLESILVLVSFIDYMYKVEVMSMSLAKMYSGIPKCFFVFPPVKSLDWTNYIKSEKPQ